MRSRRAVKSKLAANLSVKFSETKTISFDYATKEFLKNCRIRGLADDTIKYYDKEIKQMRRDFAKIRGDDIPDVKEITVYHIEQMIEHLRVIGRKTSTINSRLRSGSTFWQFLISRGYCLSNPFDGVSRLKQQHQVGATFSKRQLKRLLDSPDVSSFVGLRDLAMMLTFAHTGIRLKELNTLRLQDLVFEDKGAISLSHTKNRQARRIPMTRRLKTVLRAYVEERGILDHDILFVNIDNGPINDRTIQQRLRHYGDKSGVNKEVKVSPHAFRRTFCRLKVEAGTNVFVLQRLTGHQDLEILRKYVQIYGRDLEEAIEMGFEDF